MAYATSLAVINRIVDGAAGGLYAVPSSGAEISKGGSIFSYCSSHAAGDISGSVGFFTGVGAQPFSSTGSAHPNIVTKHANQRGMRVGDLLVNIESSAGANPGRVTWHACISSTWGGSTATYSTTAGWNCSVSSAATT